MKEKNTKKTNTICGTIVGASQVESIEDSKGQRKPSAMLHIRELDRGCGTCEVAVKVTGDLCNWVGCIGARVAVDYVVRVFDFVRSGLPWLGNDIYARSIRMM